MYCVITIFIPLSSAYISKPKGTATKSQSFKKLRFFLRAFVSLCLCGKIKLMASILQKINSILWLLSI